MSARENRGLQAAVILFAGITVVLAVATCVYFNRLQTARHTVAGLRVEVEQLERERTNYRDETQTLKQIVGNYPPQAPVSHIQHDHALDICEVFPPDDQFDTAPYRTMVAHLMRSVRDAAAREVEAIERERIREQQLERERRQNVTQLDEHRHTQEELVRELRDSRQRLHDSRDRYVAQWNDLARQLDEKAAALTDWELKHHRLQQSLSRELTKVQKRYEVMRDRWEDSLPNQEFVAPLGRVTHVDGRARTVTIDLGSADHLPRGLSLSVFTGPTDDVSGKTPKGKIEVLRIIDDHAAEARVVEDRISDLILSGDVVYTPVWKSGQERRFALVGRLDIDGDGTDDLEQVRQLILRSGATIDAVVDAAGRRTGDITVETRFLIVGKMPSGAAAGDAAPAAVAEFLDRADELGVDRMSLARFLESVGYEPKPAAEQLTARPR